MADIYVHCNYNNNKVHCHEPVVYLHHLNMSNYKVTTTFLQGIVMYL